jgi:hypothetical protein
MAYERKQVQISAFIAEETKAALDEYVAATGLKKNRVIEEALQRHLAAVDEIPANMIIETHLTTTPEGWKMIWDLIDSDEEPTPFEIESWRRHIEYIETNGKSLEDKILPLLHAADGD